MANSDNHASDTDRSWAADLFGNQDGLGTISRRTALGAATALGLGLMGTSAAAADDGDDEPPRPWHRDVDARGHDLRNLGLLEAEEAVASQFVARNDRDARYNVADRPLASSGDIELWVDPNGDDSNEGTEGNPLATLQEALNRLPLLLTHRARIHITEGVHTNDPGSVAGPPIIPNYLTGEGLEIIGDPNNPEDHVIGLPEVGDHATPHWLSLSLLGGNVHRSNVIRGVTINAKLQNYFGNLGIWNCILNGTPRPGVETCIGGYGGQTLLHESLVGVADGYTPDFLFGSVMYNDLAFGNCAGEVEDAIVHSWAYGGTIRDIGGNEIAAPRWLNNDDATVLTVRGSAEIGTRAGDTWWEDAGGVPDTIPPEDERAPAGLEIEPADELVEDFETDLDAWAGDAFQRVDVAPYQGDWHAERDHPDWDFMQSTEGLSRYPALGDQFTYYASAPDGSAVRLQFAVQSDAADLERPNLYHLDYNTRLGEDTLRVRKREGGEETDLATRGPEHVADEYVKCEVNWYRRDDDAIVIWWRVYETASDEGRLIGEVYAVDEDASFTDGGLGLATYEEGPVRIDHIHVSGRIESERD